MDLGHIGDARVEVARAISTKTYATVHCKDDCGEWDEMPEHVQAIYLDAADTVLAILPALNNQEMVNALRFYANQLPWPQNAWEQPVTVDASWGHNHNHRPDGPPRPSDALLQDQGGVARKALALASAALKAIAAREDEQ